MPTASYPIDYTGQAASNLVVDEPQVLTVINGGPFRSLIPDFAPFYVNNFKIIADDGEGGEYELTYGLDYQFIMKFIGATRGIGYVVYGGVTILNKQVMGTVKLQYQCLGGKYSADRNYVVQAIAESNYNPRMVAWDQVTSIQEVFPPTQHAQQLDTFSGLTDLITAINEIGAKIAETPDPLQGMLYQHILNRNDPHQTLALIGDNAVSQEDLDNAIEAHEGAVNPHPQYLHRATVEW